MTRSRIIGVLAGVIGAVGCGLGIAWAASQTTGTNVSCATATLPAHTIGVDGTGVDTIAGTTTSACNTVTYTIPTVTETVTASTSSSTTSATTSTSSSTTTTSSTSTGPPISGAVVPAAPTGPATPTGWSVEYADAFGACLADTATRCSLGAARGDTTLGAVTHANGAGNANEIAALEPSAVDITTQGLDLHCSQTANLGDPDTCGSVTGGAYGSSAPGAFHYTPTASTHFVLQASFQAPPNQGNMDPSFWTNGPSDNPEIDTPELWGMSHAEPSGATNTWCGYQFGDPAVPFDNGATGNVQATFCSGGVNVDPSDRQHTWTLDINGTTFTSYLDGIKIGSKTYSPFNTSAAAFKLLLMASMRKDTATGQDYPLPAGGNDLIFRYVAVYEPTTANSGGCNGPIVVPGTSIQ